MEKIKKLLAEYEIRFHDTDEILKPPPHLTVDSKFNKGEYHASISENTIYNKNGCVYDDGYWATSKITQKPKKWVVERNEEHPAWEKFKEMSIWRNFDRVSQTYYSNNKGSTILLDFRGSQYLTLDQWAEFFLPKVDFSIHNDYEFFYVRTNIGSRWLSRGNLTEGDCTSFCLDNYKIYTINKLISSKNNILEFRRPTDEEFNILYQHHPEYVPPKEGDWGIFWNKWPGATKVDSFVNMTSEGKYLDSFDYSWKNFKPFRPEIQEAINNEFDEIN